MQWVCPHEQGYYSGWNVVHVVPRYRIQGPDNAWDFLPTEIHGIVLVICHRRSGGGSDDGSYSFSPVGGAGHTLLQLGRMMLESILKLSALSRFFWRRQLGYLLLATSPHAEDNDTPFHQQTRFLLITSLGLCAWELVMDWPDKTTGVSAPSLGGP